MKFGNYNLACFKQSHELVLSGSSAKVIFEDGEKLHLSDSKIKPKELNFIKQVKNEILKNSIKMELYKKLPYYKKEKVITFFDIGFGDDFQRHGNQDIEEIDIKSAYWCAAYQTGLISLATYEKGNEPWVSKACRLACVGSPATCYTSFYYNEESDDYEMLGVKRSMDGLAAFYHKAKYVSDVMVEIFERKFAFMFWVDAVFAGAGQKGADQARWIMDQCGFKYQTHQVESVEYQKTEYIISVTVKKTGKNGEKIVKKYRKKIGEKPKKSVILRTIQKKSMDDLKKWAYKQ